MQSFEYVSPNRKSHAITLLGERWDHSAILTGGTDLLALMKDEILTPGRVVNIKDIGDLHGVSLNYSLASAHSLPLPILPTTRP